MQDYEKLGAFYLGRIKDTPNTLLYDSKDLVTHAVCVGMTGSGKTGLCIGLLEEAAIDGIPAIVIDPKGDLANLLLDLSQLWRRRISRRGSTPTKRATKGIEPAATSPQQQADLWKKGLASGSRTASASRRLQDAADFAVYTPGCNAGVPVSILKSFAAPDAKIDRTTAKRCAIASARRRRRCSRLVGIDADPVQSREHILLSTIFSTRPGARARISTSPR